MATRRKNRTAAQCVTAADTVAKRSDGSVTSAMIRRAEKLRAEQRAPFPEDSADLIREGRGQRHAHGRDQGHIS